MLEPLRRERAIRKYTNRGLLRSYPCDADELRASALSRAWWYYSVELLPGVVMPGSYPADLPMLPRVVLRRCEVADMSCLDLGTMEGVVPVLWRKRGARSVLGVDATNHCVGKMAAVRHYHEVDFGFRRVGLMYDLHRQLAGGSFDLVNCSGLLYHVFSPLAVLASARPLVKRGGLMVVSTNVTLDPDPVMDFNAGGRMHADGNTFWFTSVALLDYMLRYMRLVPIDCEFMPLKAWAGEESQRLGRNLDFEKPSGYLSVVCRAVDSVETDVWMRNSEQTSIEYQGLTDWRLAQSQPRSEIRYDAKEDPDDFDLVRTVHDRRPVMPPAAPLDSHLLALGARD
ncbi:MAG TPA: methyltransferase domain-containing protein [Thermoleophilaceae bacterium]|nr:methyltransferase domain-containing protein [Thermoleophilaceae bacterium]